ncbi:hypothetical protein HY632_01200 [Candidatus Uhrbacteria bacterium]|nr:hypothetical protein [Candidatus Uhrbacteria bacterium]
MSILLFLCSVIVLSLSFMAVEKMRPSITATLVRACIALVGFGHPILFEDSCSGCTGGNEHAAIVLQSPDGDLVAKTGFVWCPTSCVNMPQQVSQKARLTNGNLFTAYFRLDDPVEITRAFGLLKPNHITSGREVANAVDHIVVPVFNSFVQTHAAALGMYGANSRDNEIAANVRFVAYLTEWSNNGRERLHEHHISFMGCSISHE